jgi:hypothetical protein
VSEDIVVSDICNSNKLSLYFDVEEITPVLTQTTLIHDTPHTPLHTPTVQHTPHSTDSPPDPIWHGVPLSAHDQERIEIALNVANQFLLKTKQY